FSLLIFLSSLSLQGQSEDQQKIRTAFDNYKSAIRYSNGDVALAFIDQNTRDYYQEMTNAIKTADSLSVRDMNVLDKIMVLSARHRIPEEKAISMEGDQLFIYAVKYGMVAKNSVENVEIGEIVVNGNTATASLVASGQPVPMNFEFNRENNKWKIDLTSLFEISEAGMLQVIEQKGVDENMFIEKIIELSSGIPIRKNLWKPLIK
ncbi:MAG: hypothetical protein ACPF9D_11540, partial [Owenweeksia sp.]